MKSIPLVKPAIHVVQCNRVDENSMDTVVDVLLDPPIPDLTFELWTEQNGKVAQGISRAIGTRVRLVLNDLQYGQTQLLFVTLLGGTVTFTDWASIPNRPEKSFLTLPAAPKPTPVQPGALSPAQSPRSGPVFGGVPPVTITRSQPAPTAPPVVVVAKPPRATLPGIIVRSLRRTKPAVSAPAPAPILTPTGPIVPTPPVLPTQPTPPSPQMPGTPPTASTKPKLAKKPKAPRPPKTPPKRKSPVKRVWKAAKLAVGAATSVLLAYVSAAIYGRGLALEAITEAHQKDAVAIYVHDPDRNGRAIGFDYGRRRDDPETKFKAIPIDSAELKYSESSGTYGDLYYWYLALMALEDQHHESMLGFNPRALYVMPKSALRRGVAYVGGLRGKDLPHFEGGSGISDQTCGRMTYGTAAYEGRSGLRVKLDDMACGIGLRHLYPEEPERVAALYATYAPFSLYDDSGVDVFIRVFWGLDGIHDPRFGLEHQLILAALPRLRWNSLDNRWEDPDPAKMDIVSRATTALDILIKDGKIPASEREQTIEKIKAAKPSTRSESLRRALEPSGNYKLAARVVQEESEQELGVGWRERVAGVDTTFDPNILHSLATGCSAILRTLPARVQPDENAQPELAKCSGLVVDTYGQILGVYTGGNSGSEAFDISASSLSPGSLGKLLVASRLAGKYKKGPHEDNRFGAFEGYLRKSSRLLHGAARMLGVRNSEVQELIECYGTPNAMPGKDHIENAVNGRWDTTAYDFIRFMSAAYTGETLLKIHGVSGFRFRDGKTLKRDVPTDWIESDRDRRCTELAWADGYARSWFTIPLEEGGTLSALSGIAHGGKTGTVKPTNPMTQVSAFGTNAVYTAAAIAPEGNHPGYFVFVRIGADHSTVNIGNNVTSSDVAAPYARKILETVRIRRNSGKLHKPSSPVVGPPAPEDPNDAE